MGEFIKNPRTGQVIKIGVLDECFYSREKLLKFKERGFKGFYNGRYDDTLDNMINDSSTLYRLDLEIPGIDELKFLIPVQGIIIHQKNCRFNNCHIVEAGIAGERWWKGQKRTVFRCADCGSPFSVGHLSAMFLRASYPEIAELFNSDEERKDFGPDLSLFETLELIVDLYPYSDLVKLIGEKEENEVKKYGYKSFLEFYNDRLSYRLALKRS